MSRQASEFQEKSMSLVYRGKEIFKLLNTGRIDERVSCIRHKTISSGDDCCEYWYVGDTSPEALANSGSK